MGEINIIDSIRIYEVNDFDFVKPGFYWAIKSERRLYWQVAISSIAIEKSCSIHQIVTPAKPLA